MFQNILAILFILKLIKPSKFYALCQLINRFEAMKSVVTSYEVLKPKFSIKCFSSGS